MVTPAPGSVAGADAGDPASRTAGRMPRSARRKQLLAQIVKDVPGIKVSEHITATGRAFFQTLSRQDLEGMVAKLAKSRYVAGQRSKTWLKIKVEEKEIKLKLLQEMKKLRIVKNSSIKNLSVIFSLFFKNQLKLFFIFHCFNQQLYLSYIQNC